MPRRSRIDTPRSLHHIMCRGIEKRKIFDIDVDRVRFLERLGEILRAAEEAMEKTASRVAEVLGVEEEVWTKGRYRRIVEARRLLCYWAVRELGVTMASLAGRLEISIPAVSKSVSWGKELADAGGYSLL